MKQLIYTILFLCFLFQITSCSVKELTVQNKINRTTESYYKTTRYKSLLLYFYKYDSNSLFPSRSNLTSTIRVFESRRNKLFETFNIDTLFNFKDTIYYVETNDYYTTGYLIKYKNDFYSYYCYENSFTGNCDSIKSITDPALLIGVSEVFNELLEKKKEEKYFTCRSGYPTFIILVKNNKVKLKRKK